MRRIVLPIALLGVFLPGCGGGESSGLGGIGLPDLSQTEGGEFTILLRTFSGPGHVRDAKYFKEQTERHARWRRLFVLHEEGASSLFWGRYASVEAASGNLKAAKEWKAPTGQAIYTGAMVTPVPGPEPGPAEWNLRNVEGAWTLVVAIFYNMPAEGIHPAYTRRKEDAVAYCKWLREEKKEQVYFLHEGARSYVTIGTFPASAMRWVERGGQYVQEMVDSRLRAAQLRHAKLAVNGREEWRWITDPKTGQKEKLVSASYPMEIPQRGPFDGSAPAGGGNR